MRTEYYYVILEHNDNKKKKTTHTPWSYKFCQCRKTPTAGGNIFFLVWVRQFCNEHINNLLHITQIINCWWCKLILNNCKTVKFRLGNVIKWTILLLSKVKNREYNWNWCDRYQAIIIHPLSFSTFYIFALSPFIPKRTINKKSTAKKSQICICSNCL